MNLLLYIALGILMFSLGLNLDLEDFRKQLKNPKSIIIGLCTQLILPCSLALVLISLFQLEWAIAMWVLLGSAVPGWTTSGLITHWSKWDTALSISLTAVNWLVITLFSLPLIIYYGYNRFLSEGIVSNINTSDIILQLFVVTVLPIAISLLIKHFIPILAKKIKKVFDHYMIIYYVVVILIGIFFLVRDFDLFSDHIWTLFVVSILSNIALLAIAYGVASLFKLDHKTSKTIAIETSFQNNNLAFALAISVISIPIVGIPSLFYGLIMTVMGLVIVFIERYRHKRFHIPH